MAAAISDIRTRRISNRLNGAFAFSYIILTGAMLLLGKTTISEVGMSALWAFGVFALFLILFYVGAMGGGDVKLVGVTALWVPAGHIPQFLILIALVGGLVALITLIHSKVKKLSNPEVPYGVAIAASGLWVCGQPIIRAL